MKDDKFLQEEMLSDDELENVVGGSNTESNADGIEFEKLGFNIFDGKICGKKVLGWQGYQNLSAAFENLF